MTRQGCLVTYMSTYFRPASCRNAKATCILIFFFPLVFVGRRKSTFYALSLCHSCFSWVERRGTSYSLPVRDALTGGVMGEKLTQGRPCSAQGPVPQPLPALGCWDPLACSPPPGSSLSCSSKPRKFLSLERQRWGSGLPGDPENQKVSTGSLFLAGDGEGDSTTGAARMSSHGLPSAASSTLLFPIIYYLTTVLVCFSPGCEPGGLVLGPPPPGALPRRQCLPPM